MKRTKIRSKAGKAKVRKVFREAKAGKLHSGSRDGPIVRKRSQQIAIALSEGRKADRRTRRRARRG